MGFILVFKYPSRDRVKIKYTAKWKLKLAISIRIKKVSFTNKGIEFLSQTPNFNSYIFATMYHRLLIFQTINYVREDSLGLKYQRFTPTCCEDIRIRKFEFVTKTNFLFTYV